MITKPQAWWIAIRPKTLTAALITVAVGIALAYGEGFPIDWWIAFLTLGTTTSFQIASNFFNDALDAAKGADTKERKGFVRVTNAGLLTGEEVIRGGWIAIAFAFAFGIPLVLKGGAFVIFALLLGALASYAYTGGPYPLAYHGLGEVFVLLFFGYIGVPISYYLQTGTLSFAPFLAGTQVGLLADVLIALNNFRDIQTDRKANKWTLAARFGEFFARYEIMAFLWIPFMLTPFWNYFGFTIAAFLPLAMVPLALIITQGIWKPSVDRLINGYFVLAALLHLTFGLLLTIGLIL